MFKGQKIISEDRYSIGLLALSASIFKVSDLSLLNIFNELEVAADLVHIYTNARTAYARISL